MSGRWTLFHKRLGRRLKPRARCYLAMAGRVTGSATISNEGGPRAPVASARVQDDSGSSKVTLPRAKASSWRRESERAGWE